MPFERPACFETGGALGVGGIDVDAAVDENQKGNQMNRIGEYFRDPALEQPETDYFVVRVPFERFVVARGEAERILAAMTAHRAPSVVRCQTVHGSVVFVRPETVLYVRECTRAQRDAERRFWKEIDDEEDEDDWL